MTAGLVSQVDEGLELLAAALDRVAATPDWQLSDDQVLRRIDQLGQQISRLTGARMRAIGEAGRRKICEDQQGWTLANHLVTAQPQPIRAARATVRLADRLARFGRVGEAICAGRLTVQQAEAITGSLDELPATVSTDELDQAQSVMVEHAARFDAAGLRRIGNHLGELLCPDSVDDKLGRQLSRQESRALRDRYLDWQYTGDGSISFRAKLPVVPGEAFVAQLDAYTQQARIRGLERAIDPEAEMITAGQRRADALISMVDDLQTCRLAPSTGGDRPRAIITVQYDDLVAGIRGGSLLGSGEPVSPAIARRIACCGELLPAVLGGPSVVLDVGRTVRLFSGALRNALVLRDGGCVFPGCDAAPSRCEGHHIDPWWSGGRTALTNGVLVCSHHHHLIEPDPHASPGSRWEIRLDRQGLPEVLPPLRVDPHRRPRQHTRFAERSLRQRR